MFLCYKSVARHGFIAHMGGREVIKLAGVEQVSR
jgi:hypothetical protein